MADKDFLRLEKTVFTCLENLEIRIYSMNEEVDLLKLETASLKKEILYETREYIHKLLREYSSENNGTKQSRS